MKEVIILGRGPSWKECPFDAETWGTSSTLQLPGIDISKISKVFAIDDSHLVKPDAEIAKRHSIPLLSMKEYATEPYPLAEILKEFEPCYMRNTVTYMLAYAIYKRYEKIRLYGVDQGPQWEYLLNRVYVYFWLGVANGRKIKCEIAKTSVLTKPFQEEFQEYCDELARKAGLLRRRLEYLAKYQ